MTAPTSINSTFVFRKNDDIGAAGAEDDEKFLSECFVDTGDLSVLVDCEPARKHHDNVPTDILITSQANLYSLIAERRGTFSPSQGDIVINLKSLPPASTLVWEARLNNAYHDCGCAAGTIAAIGTLLPGIAYFLIQPGGLRSTSGFEYLTLFFLFFLFTTFGKIAGLALARKRLRRDLGTLLAELKRTKPKQ